MTTSTISYPKHVDRCISRALAGKSKLPIEALSLAGFSTPTVRRFLNNLCSFHGVNYLEVGTFKGSTLIPASYRNSGQFTAIDNFTQFAQFGHHRPLEHLARLRRRFRADCHFTLRNADCWSDSIIRKLPTNINVYFYDGPHRPEDHYQAFVHFDPVFASRFVAVVDDWNWPFVRKATRAAFASLGYATVLERELFTAHWWNGLFVAVVQKRRRPPSGSRPRHKASTRRTTQR